MSVRFAEGEPLRTRVGAEREEGGAAPGHEQHERVPQGHRVTRPHQPVGGLLAVEEQDASADGAHRERAARRRREFIAFAVAVRAKQIGPVRIERPRQSARTWDLCAVVDAPLLLNGGVRASLSTGWSFRVPEGFEVAPVSRPELTLAHGVTVLAYDQGKAHELFIVILHNRTRQPYTSAPRTQITWALVVPDAVLRALEEARD